MRELRQHKSTSLSILDDVISRVEWYWWCDKSIGSCMVQEHDPDAMQALKEGDAEAEKTMAAMDKTEKTYDPNDPEEEAVEATEAEGVGFRLMIFDHISKHLLAAQVVCSDARPAEHAMFPAAV